MNLPLQSIVRPSFAALIVFASSVAAILSPSMMIVAFWTICEGPGLIIVPLIRAIFSARTGGPEINRAIASAIFDFIRTHILTSRAGMTRTSEAVFLGTSQSRGSLSSRQLGASIFAIGRLRFALEFAKPAECGRRRGRSPDTALARESASRSHSARQPEHPASCEPIMVFKPALAA